MFTSWWLGLHVDVSRWYLVLNYVSLKYRNLFHSWITAPPPPHHIRIRCKTMQWLSNVFSIMLDGWEKIGLSAYFPLYQCEKRSAASTEGVDAYLFLEVKFERLPGRLLLLLVASGELAGDLHLTHQQLPVLQRLHLPLMQLLQLERNLLLSTL